MGNGQSERFGNIKEKNLKLLFNLICDRAGISRAQLSRETGLSKPAVSELADELIGRGYVKMSGTDDERRAGRRAVCLEPDPSYGVFLSVSLNERTADCRLYDFALGLLGEASFGIEYRKGCIVDLIERILESSDVISSSRVVCTCFSLPAAVDSNRSEIRSTVLNFDESLNLIKEIEALEISGTKALINETIAYCYAEYAVIKDETEDMLFVEVSDGVGAGIVIGGKVFRGAGGSAGEFGHTSVDADGPLCCCGRRGCLEQYISRRAIVASAMERNIIKNEKSGLAGIRERFDCGDGKAMDLYDSIADKLAFGLGNMVAMFDISLIIIGGGIEVLGDGFLDMVREKTENYMISGEYRTRGRLSIEYSRLTPDSKNLGSVRYFRDNILTLGCEPEDGIYYI